LEYQKKENFEKLERRKSPRRKSMAKVTFKGSPIETNGELPRLKSRAPEFNLIDGELKEHRLKDFKGKRKLLSIVPSLDTSVCSLSTKKFNEFAAKHPEFIFLVISADLPFAQKRFCSAEGVKNVLTLSLMRSKDFAREYGILMQTGPLAGLCARSVVVLDENDQVIYTELVPEITHEPNYDKAIAALMHT
jgi:thioredoxin-dependent peroxiredoxin